MPISTRHPVTGCDASQLIGHWVIDPEKFDAMLAFVQENPLPEPQASLGTEGDGPALYTVIDGIAMMEISGPMTRKLTSFQGMLGGTSTISLRNSVRAAVDDPNVRGIWLEIDSPGGTVAGTNALGDDIAYAAARKPLIAFIPDLAASGAVWACTQAGYVIADPVARIGSIGAIARLTDTSGIYDKKGIKVTYVRTAPMKALGQAGEPVTDEQVADTRRELDDVHQAFVGAIARGRGITVEQVNKAADGRMYIAADALSLGLIDKIMTRDQAWSLLHQSTAIDNRWRGRADRLSVPIAAAPEKDFIMLSNEQLASLRTLPGCSGATQENAAELALQAATTLQTGAKTAAEQSQAQIQTLTAENTTLRADRDTARKQNEKPPASTLKLIASGSKMKMQNAVTKQAITPAIGDALYAALVGADAAEGKEAAYRDVALIAEHGGQPLAAAVFDILADNIAGPKLGTQTGVQPVPNVAAGDDAAAKAVSDQVSKQVADFKKTNGAAA